MVQIHTHLRRLTLAATVAAQVVHGSPAVQSTIDLLAVHEQTMADNAAGIDDCVASISSNNDAIGALQTDASDNADVIASNSAAIADNTVAISGNSAAISGNTEAISGNADGIDTVSSTLSTALSSSIPGTESNPAASCRQILHLGGDAHNGHYYLDHGGNEEPYKAYCDMGRGGLELVFKLQHGISGNAASLWMDHVGVNADSSGTHMNLFASGDHFVSDKLESFWADAGTQLHAVHAGVYNGNRRMAHFTFDASGTDTESWFSREQLQDSSYNDLLTADVNFFSIEGDSSYGRSWFVNSNYGGCDVDAGWLVLDSTESDPCDWESVYGDIDILFNPKQTLYEANNYVPADTFAVLIDYDIVYASCQDALAQTNFRARDGNYWIDHAGTSEPAIVFCDMENGGYELVFKVVHGGRVSPKWDDTSADTQNPSAYDLWIDSQYNFPNKVSRNVDLHDETNAYGNGEHYPGEFRLNAFSESSIVVDTIEVRLMTAETEVKFVQFFGVPQDDVEAWFGYDYLGSSSWSDLQRDSTFNYFSIAGHESVDRNFYINQNYGGCTVDAGWMVVVGRTDGCDWEEREYGTPDVMYSCTDTEYYACAAEVDSDSDDCSTVSASDVFCYADLMAVFFKWHSE